MTRAGLAAATAVLLAAAAGQAQGPTPAQVQAALRDVGQVEATGCSGSGARSGTAFVWPDEARVVTARHVVAGCQTVRVRFPGRPSVMASPERELVREDLLLLRLAQPSGKRPVVIETRLPPVHARVAAVGYALGAPTPADKLLTVDATNVEPGQKLRHVLPDRIRATIQANGPWSIETGIVRLDGNLLPGHSGAPLVGPGGTVVAVGAGGLQDGAGGVVWAVRAAYLPQLARAPVVASLQALSRPSSLAFADQAPQAQLQSANCGTFTLARSRTVPLSVLGRDTDDPRGLQQLLATVGVALRPRGADRFDLWVDQASGASIALPEGTRLVNGPVGCVAAVSPTVGFNIVTYRATATDPAARQAEIQQVSQAFEYGFMAALPGLVADPSFTYMLPLFRPDGFVVNRKGARRDFQTGFNQAQTDYVFLTHMTRGNTYVGVSAVRMNQQVPIDTAMACGSGQPNPQCAAYHAAFADWARAAVGVHLSTIPPI